jgi:hypothetical protein
MNEPAGLLLKQGIRSDGRHKRPGAPHGSGSCANKTMRNPEEPDAVRPSPQDPAMAGAVEASIEYLERHLRRELTSEEIAHMYRVVYGGRPHEGFRRPPKK